MIRLERINGQNVREILNLRVGEKQKSFVAPNDFSLIEAYIAIAHHGHAFSFGIYDEDTPPVYSIVIYGLVLTLETVLDKKNL